jgi:nucleoside-diphosphate-sugar epimerase
MELVNGNIGVLGHSGFVGKALLEALPGAIGISLRDDTWVSKMMQCTVIINLVGKAHDHKGMASEQDYYNTNLELSKNIFEVFLQSPVNLLVHISSLAALEEFESSIPLQESDACNPVSWYGKSKRSAEEWLLSQELPPGKRIIILRPPMIHGPGDKGNLGLLYKMIKRGIPYPLASFDNKRSFISIDNFVFFIKKIFEKYECLPSGIYHISDDEYISTKQIIGVIKEITGKNVSNFALPKYIVKAVARLGDFLPIPLNSKRLKKMTGDLLVSNEKIKNYLEMERLPLTAVEGMKKTIGSFLKEKV